MELETNSFSFTEEQLKRLEEIIAENKPERVIELGSGVTTELLRKYKFKELISIEHDKDFMDEEKTFLPIIWNFKTKERKFAEFGRCLLYSGLEEFLKKRGSIFDLVIIDGPYSFMTGPNIRYHRIQLLSLIPYLNPESIILFHDSEREGNKNTLNRFERMMRGKFTKEEIKSGITKHLTIYRIKK